MMIYSRTNNNCRILHQLQKLFRYTLFIVLLGAILTACGEEGVENADFNSELIGRWWMDDLAVSLTFNTDGTGTEVNDGSERSFEWTAEDGNLTRESVRAGEIRIDNWSYSINGDILRIITLHNGLEHEFRRSR